jgi:type IV secretory pathway TraG/TraD family ATPase VirD4
LLQASIWLRQIEQARSVVLCILFAIAIVGLLIGNRRGGRSRHRRGVLVIDGHRAQRRAALRLSLSSDIVSVAGVGIPRPDETKHFKMIGTTGTGKSTAIRELLGRAIARGDRAVIADPDGAYLARFYDRYRGDIVLNPFESGSVKWNWFGELQKPYDIEQLASALIPASEDPATQEWRGYARAFFSAVARRCQRDGHGDSAELWRLLTVAGPEELRPIVAGSPAQPFLDPDNSRMFGSIRSVTGSAVAPFEHIQAQRTALFSVRSWVRTGGGSALLFIPYKAGQIAALRTLIAAWIRLAIFEAMSGAEEEDQRLWFIVDELDALGAIDGLKDAMARLRKFGGRVVLGFQSIAQVSSTYGAGSAQTIVENCGNTFILRCSGSENGGTSQFASKLIGEREVNRRQTSRGRDREGIFGTRGARRSTSITEQTTTETAVLPSEIEQLPDLAGYLKLVSSPAWLKLKLRPS